MRARVPNWFVLYAVWNRGFWKRVVCCEAKGQSAKHPKHAYARGRERIQTRSQVNIRGGHRQVNLVRSTSGIKFEYNVACGIKYT